MCYATLLANTQRLIRRQLNARGQYTPSSFTAPMEFKKLVLVLCNNPPLLSEDPFSYKTTLKEEDGYSRGCTSPLLKQNMRAISPRTYQQRYKVPRHIQNVPALSGGAERLQRRVRRGVRGTRGARQEGVVTASCVQSTCTYSGRMDATYYPSSLLFSNVVAYESQHGLKEGGYLLQQGGWQIVGTPLAHKDLSKSPDKSQHTLIQSSPIRKFTLLEFWFLAPPWQTTIPRRPYTNTILKCTTVNREYEISKQPPSRWHSTNYHGLPFETIFNLTEQAQVDHRAFLSIQHVWIAISILGVNSLLWGDLSHFRRVVQHLYHHEVHGALVYKVDLRGSIGICKLRLCDIVADVEREPYCNLTSIELWCNQIMLVCKSGSAQELGSATFTSSISHGRS